MNDKLTKDQLADILLILDDAIEKGPWSGSTFLSLIGKKLHLLREQVATEIDNPDMDGNQTSVYKKAQPGVNRFADMKKIFISLYAFDGSNLQSWERIIAHLPAQVISRPIYEKEEDAIAMIRSKTNRINEAYVAMYIDPNAVLPPSTDKPLIDKLGKPLLTLKGRTLDLENIESFVHSSGAYRYIKGRLIKK